jgi:heptosyltransferase-2
VKNILVIQTAFIGDAILGTAVLEKLHRFYPGAKIDYLVRKGNESLFQAHPFIHQLLIWDKQEKKYAHLLKLLEFIKQQQYDAVINLQRFAATGFLTAFSGAKQKIGFDKNPFSLFFTKKVKHEIKAGIHEVNRNLKLIENLTDNSFQKPKLYPSALDKFTITSFTNTKYITVSPASVWFTKQLPEHKWIDFINIVPPDYNVYLLGSKDDAGLCENIISKSTNKNIISFAGKLSLLQSAALMQKAIMNYVNDSAPMHLASAMNANTCAIYCSTVPDFGFGPLADKSVIIQTKEELKCRPCGLHGRENCPQKHFKCAETIDVIEMVALLS